ncbi:MAG: sulfatase-like hydrolase/transferase, partial [Planctomycetota bacterium]
MIVALTCTFVFSANAEDKARPNILVIVTDDQAPHTLSVYGNTVCETPNLDRLAARGMTLDAAYHMGSWSGAVCRPSRTMIMTGRTVWRIPSPGGRNLLQANRPDSVPPDLHLQSMPAVFNQAGYDTFRTCKPGNTYPPANELFKTLKEARKVGGDEASGSAWYGDRAVDFLEAHEARGGDVPFLMFYGFSHPHDVRDGTPELLQKYGAYNAKQPPTEVNPNAPPLPIAWLPKHPFANPHGHDNLRDEVRVSGVMTSRSEATVRNELGREYACIENIDRQIGRV